MKTLHEIMAEEESATLAKTRAEIAAEDAAWAALPQAEKDRIHAEREALFADCADTPETEECDECGCSLDDCECTQND